MPWHASRKCTPNWVEVPRTAISHFTKTTHMPYADYTYKCKNPLRRYSHQRRIAMSLSFIDRYLPKNGSILDFGCADGYMLGQLGTLRPDCKATGFEPSHLRCEDIPRLRQAPCRRRQIRHCNMLRSFGTLILQREGGSNRQYHKAPETWRHTPDVGSCRIRDCRSGKRDNQTLNHKKTRPAIYSRQPVPHTLRTACPRLARR